MNRNKKISMAVLAGAAAISMGSSAHAALQLEAIKTGSVVVSNGTYDLYDIIVTGMTAGAGTNGQTLQSAASLNVGGAADNTVGPVTADDPNATNGIAADPEIVQLNGSFTAASGFSLGVPGFSGTTGTHPYTKYLVDGGAPQLTGTPANTDASYVPYPNVLSATLTGSTGASTTGAAALKGNATAFSGTFFNGAPGYTGITGSTNNQGGVEPGADVTQTGLAPNGLLAEILVTVGGAFTYSGSYTDYGNGGNQQALSFTVGATTPPPTTHTIVALTDAGGAAPTNYGTKQGTVTVTGGAGSYTPSTGDPTTGLTAATGYVEGKTFTPGTDKEIYALDIKNGTAQASDIAAIVNAINNGVAAASIAASTGVVASATLPAGAVFPGGPYNLYLTFTGQTSGDENMGWDLAETGSGIAAGDVVASVALIPEPATAGLLLFGASSLLLGRRRKQMQMA